MRVVPYDKNDFVEMNNAWISEMFVLEAEDERELENIEPYIIPCGFAHASQQTSLCLSRPEGTALWALLLSGGYQM